MAKKNASMASPTNIVTKRQKIASPDRSVSSNDSSEMTLPFRNVKNWTVEDRYRAVEVAERAMQEEDVTCECDHEGQEEIAWQCFIEENMKFPFRALTPIRKSDGTKTKKILKVVGPRKNIRLSDDQIYVDVEYKGILMKYDLFELEPIDASDDMLYALQIWQHSLGMDIDTEYICNVDAPTDLEETD